MTEWILENMQFVHLIAFALACLSPEWRRPGLILSGFALLYIGLGPFNEMLRATSPSLLMLMYACLDMIGAAMILNYARPGKNNTSFLYAHWVGLSGILIAFWMAHYLNYCYTLGYAVSLSVSTYNLITVILALTQVLIMFPGVKEGVYEVRKLAFKKLASPGSVYNGPHKVLHDRRGSGKNAWHRGLVGRCFSSLLVDRGSHRGGARK